LEERRKEGKGSHMMSVYLLHGPSRHGLSGITTALGIICCHPAFTGEEDVFFVEVGLGLDMEAKHLFMLFRE
jgi:hypothetical protein